jgi:hypothetical protein
MRGYFGCFGSVSECLLGCFSVFGAKADVRRLAALGLLRVLYLFVASSLHRIGRVEHNLVKGLHIQRVIPLFQHILRAMLFKKRRDEGDDILAMNKRSHYFCLSPYLLDLKNHFYFECKLQVDKTTPCCWCCFVNTLTLAFTA